MELDALYRRSVEGWVAAAGRAPADWSGPTPCSDWTVHDLVNHVVGEDRWTRPLVEGRTIADVGDTLDGDLLGDDPVAAARAAAEDALAAVADRLPHGGKVHLSYGDEDLGEYLRQLVGRSPDPRLGSGGRDRAGPHARPRGGRGGRGVVSRSRGHVPLGRDSG